MNEPEKDDAIAAPAVESERRKQRKRELIYAGVALVIGLIVLPLMIFVVGTVLLGPYAGGKTLGVFLAEFYGNLGHGVPRTWFVVLAPYLAYLFVRLSFLRYRSFGAPIPGETPPPPSPAVANPAQNKQPAGRREPFIGS